MVNNVNRSTSFNIGISGIDRWRKQDDVHLPKDKRAPPVFLPETRPLDRILRRETLDERLARDVIPEDITAELLEPKVLANTRKRLSERLFEASMRASGDTKARILEGLTVLDDEVEMDEDIQEALAALMRG